MALAVRNWERFQHYKQRRPPWVKLHRSLLDNRDWVSLSLAGKALAPGIWLLASEQHDGRIPDDVGELAFRLRCDEAHVIEGVTALIAGGFLVGSLNNAGDLLAPRQQSGVSETETETEGERERTQARTQSAPRTGPPPTLPAEWEQWGTAHGCKDVPKQYARFAAKNSDRKHTLAKWQSEWIAWTLNHAVYACPCGAGGPPKLAVVVKEPAAPVDPEAGLHGTALVEHRFAEYFKRTGIEPRPLKL